MGAGMKLHLDDVFADDQVECRYNGVGTVESADGQIVVEFLNGRTVSYNSSGVCQTSGGVPTSMKTGLGTLQWWDPARICIARKNKTIVLKNSTVTVGR